MFVFCKTEAQTRAENSETANMTPEQFEEYKRAQAKKKARIDARDRQRADREESEKARALREVRIDHLCA